MIDEAGPILGGELRDQLVQHAKDADRTLSAEIRRALSAHAAEASHEAEPKA